ncbi:lauroyl acyltransferase [Brumimicrobium salinarum]|uniref:Lauroyl acyltransferase n=1 Tax=Brumimicrobium salinarum TaxID=2058658 RepID=A0A2I0R319_9FLAO|nr:lauroyl acyltransferase [Brumimicrobium salinarum]PKR80790.1 lauroyl acyltransferase [Brumimicrobium salinarum]
MSKFISALVYFVIVIPISHLPFKVLYFISDLVYLLLYYIVGYRKKVVRENLKNSFPELDNEARSDIEKKFYKHFADFLVESTKSLSISNKAIQERCALINPEEVHKYFDQGKDVIVLCGHYNNWEYYAVGIAQQMKHQTIAAYRPLKNGFYNRKILKSRQRFGMKMLSMREIPRFFAQKPKNPPVLSVMVNDQSPGDPKSAYWNTFLNQDTGWMKGAEKLAKKYNQVILFGAIRKRKRGFYEVSFTPISEDITKERDGYVLDKHAEYLERVIQEHPQYWLWSHRRWKHKKPNTP